jgi:lysosomal acid lipase/cholesteryl ester hydrolase
MWQSILYPPIFAKLIDTSLGFLFAWYGHNISTTQKIAAYAHLYSTTSTKSVVHWFQIMRNATFQMYDDDINANTPMVRLSSASAAYVPAKFPTRNIASPVVLLWGDCDSLVDIEMMLAQLPKGTREKRLESYEHLDILWGDRVHEDVIPEVLDVLLAHCEGSEKSVTPNNGIKG